jgi:N-methylhydantoinase A
VLSALGMLASRPGRQLSRTWLGLLGRRSEEEILGRLRELAAEGVASLSAEGARPETLEVRFSLDLRYRGQSYTLNVPWEGSRERAAAAFEERHEQRYGHRLEVPLELVNLRAAVLGRAPGLELSPATGQGGETPVRAVRVHGIAGEVPVWRRDALAPGMRVPGPGILAETVATSWVAPGWQGTLDAWGNLVLERAGRTADPASSGKTG